jgi:uncharacterized delta-60 repeat protein
MSFSRNLVAVAVVAGALLSTGTAAHAGAGQLDTRFGIGGFAVIKRAPSLTSIAQRDGYRDSAGRTVIAGFATPFVGTAGVVLRVTASGIADPSFGSNGYVVVPPPPGNTLLYFEAVAAAPDDRIVAAGLALPDVNGEISARVRVCRFTSNGAADPTFGTDGCTAVALMPGSITDRFHDMRVQPDGRILIYASSGTLPARTVLARLNPDGSPDPCFGDGVACLVGGVVVLPLHVQIVDHGRLALGGDGRFVFTGRSGGAMLVARMLPTGVLDPQFGVGGVRTFTTGIGSPVAASAAVLADNAVVVVGYRTSAEVERLAVVAKLLSNGTIDPGFGIAGYQVFSYTDVSFNSRAEDVLVQPDGALLVVGTTQIDQSGDTVDTRDCAVARFRPDGTFDGRFGFDGRNNFNSGSVDDEFIGADVPDECRSIGSHGHRALLIGLTGGLQFGRMMVVAVDLHGIFRDTFE